MDMCFELAGRIIKALGPVTVVDETHGFRFFDNRDLLGFVDGTENPDGPLAVAATEIGDEDAAFAGGCYVHVQKYLHDMPGWDSLTVIEQELVIGRSKLEDIEMDDDDETGQRPYRAQRDRRRRRHRAEDRPAQHAVRRDR